MIRIKMGPRRNHSVVSALLGGTLCAGLAGFGFFVVISGADIGGGIPLLPAGINQAMGRVIFGVGAVFTASLAAYAFYEAWHIYRRKRQ
ncbi:hypothetical protein K8B33_09900 [Alcanivorax sp. JB21]|uniref:hypothetical protein n=1 Tax=Alcanivorax limicola TaxID=2874102 RepID=UPI001CC0B905|nr:hypothetical protein [Alcanivorax limicola]MBZ2189409.1 hypothetical protein [Alcanivorax limicola]